MSNKSLLFIPDITGFTEFVHSTEVEHGQHIISELLEKIIDGNTLQMEVSEVEGDAVLFYKEGDVPTVEAVFSQVKKMFLDFHSHLKLYDQQRICECGACSSAARLSLKFVVHSGKIGFTNIKNQKKPFGADVVLLHRLLKNDIKTGEYLLLTEQFVKTGLEKMDDAWSEKLRHGKQQYPAIGQVDYHYLELTDLHKEVPDPPPLQLPKKMQSPICNEHLFNIGPMEAYEYLSNFELKKRWNKDVSKFEYEHNKVNRVGTKHTCLFERGSADFVSTKNDFGEGNLVYGETLLNFPLTKELTTYFILSPVEDKTKIRIETHYQPVPLVGWLMRPFIKMLMNKVNRKFIESFSELKRKDWAPSGS
jgi:hypothetical protein